MEHPVLVWSIAGFVLLGAISMVIHAIASWRMYQAVRDIRGHIAPLVPEAKAVLASARETLEQSRTELTEISTRAKSALDSTKSQLALVEEIVVDATTRAKRQLERTELVVEDTVARVHDTVSAVQGSVLRPLREVNGLAAGVKAGVQQLFRGSRPAVDRATQDEEMFI